MMETNQYFQQPMPLFQGYGINPAYATPAYMANFRPAYSHQGGDQANPYASDMYASEGRMWDTIIPFPFSNHTSYNVDPLAYSASVSNDMNNNVVDAGAGLSQRVLTPLAAWYASNKILGMKIGAPIGSFADKSARATAYAGSLLSGRGRSAAAAAAAAAAGKQTLSSAFGTFMGRGMGSALGSAGSLMSRTIGMGAAPRLAATMASGGALAGGIIGGFALPFMAAIAASKVAEETLFDPFISIRRGEDALLANTANQFIGGASRTISSRFGMSHIHAEKLSRALTDAGTQDFAFEAQDYNIMNDYAMRSGLMNDIGNLDVESMKKRVEGMAKTVKLIMAVANTSSVKEAIEYMGRIKAGGVTNPLAANAVINQLGLSSAVSGASVEQIMNTVGNQSQLMFQRDGMLPVLGQISGAATFAGFANAYKAGLISTASLATVGGVEGATQNFMETSLGLMKSPLAAMSLMTDRPLQEGPMGLVRSRSAFGQRAAVDPLGLRGDISMNRDFYASKRIAEDGLVQTTWDLIQGHINHLPGNITRAEDGRYDMQKVMGAMASMGMSEEQIRSTMMMFKQAMDPVALGRARQAGEDLISRTAAQRMNQEGMLLAGTGIGQAWYGARGWGKDVKEQYLNPIAGFFTDVKARASDSIERTMNMWTGITTGEQRGWYEIDNDNRTRTRYSIEGKDYKLNGLGLAQVQGTGQLGNAMKDPELVQEYNSTRNAKLAEPLMNAIYDLKDSEGEAGDAARALLHTLTNGGKAQEGRDTRQDLFVLNQAVKGSALDKATLRMDDYEATKEYAKLIENRNIRIRKDVVKTDSDYTERANMAMTEAILTNTKEDAGWNFLGSERYRPNARAQAGSDMGLVKAVGDVAPDLLRGILMEEDGSAKNNVDDIVYSAALRKALAKSPSERTEEDKAIIKRMSAVSMMTGIPEDLLRNAARSGSATSGSGQDLSGYITKNERKIADNTGRALSTLLANAEEGEQRDRIMQFLGKNDPEFMRKLETFKPKTFTESASGFMRNILSPVFGMMEDVESQNNKNTNAAADLNAKATNFGAMKDFEDVVTGMQAFTEDLGSSGKTFKEAADKIAKAADTLERVSDGQNVPGSQSGGILSSWSPFSTAIPTKAGLFGG